MTPVLKEDASTIHMQYHLKMVGSLVYIRIMTSLVFGTWGFECECLRISICQYSWSNKCFIRQLHPLQQQPEAAATPRPKSMWSLLFPQCIKIVSHWICQIPCLVDEVN